ncbi:Ig-like domain-containing protein [Planococcus sp. N028]|uniref:Ig-like domain-containing protein n=1 Tax=Planococcus shixiaomingii TaxID=3058393 RepID=A0ABT8N1X5_9BACL|nr:Ig-like domain-containing protein [Planococcus sp. N028]MDN7241699.1 Ig-like domain-containing protein [Planococcus sp. N028]
MKKLLLVFGTAALIFITFLMVPLNHKAEADDNGVKDVKIIKRNFDFSTVNVFDKGLITTYDGKSYEPTVISSYSKTGSLNWEINVKPLYAIAEERFVTIDSNKLFIHSTATGEILKTVTFPGLLHAGQISKVYIDEKYILVTGTSSKILVYGVNGNLIRDFYADGVQKAVLYKDTVIFQNSNGLHSLDISTRSKLWHVPLVPRTEYVINLQPAGNNIYIRGYEKERATDPAPSMAVLRAIDASTGAVLYKKEFSKYEETAFQVKDFGIITSHYVEDVHNFYNPDGTLNMTRSMESAEVKQFKQKYRISGIRYNSTHNYMASQDGLFFFKRYSGIDDEYVFSSIKSLDKSGRVKFEKVVEEYVFSMAATKSNKLFVSNGMGDYEGANKLSVYDPTGTLLDTIETEHIPHLTTDGYNVYGYGRKTLYIFKESEPNWDVTALSVPSVNTLNDNSTVLTGKAQTGAKVFAYAGGKLIGETTAANGAFSISIAKQPAGTIVEVYATDQAGNKSVKQTIKVIDKTAPPVPSVNTVSDKSVAITGKAETNAKVYAYIGNKKLSEATAKNGAYSIAIAMQKAGTTISIYAEDAAGNKSTSKTIKVIDKTAPAVPSVNTVGDNSTTVSGKAESGAKVYAYVGSTKLGEATAKSGAYSIKIAKQKTGTIIAVYAVDASNNKSGSKSVKVVDKTAPPIPTVNKVTSKSTAVAGKGEKAATVLIYNGSKKIGQGTVDSKGNLKVKIVPQKKGSFLKVYAQDKAGNKSGSRTVKVY